MVAAGETDELVFCNATVITMDDHRPEADGFAVSDGKFTFVGTNLDLKSRIGPETRVIDLADRVVLPGLIDAHLHPVPQYQPGHRLHRVALGASTTASMGVLIDRLRAQADTRPAGEWIVGQGYEDTVLRRHPNRHDLDAVSVRHPVYITHSSGHRAVANSMALQLAGITTDTADPPGGAFLRNDEGTPNGMVLETAMAPLRSAQRTQPSAAELMDGIQTTLQKSADAGLTTVVDAAPYPAAWAYPVYQALRNEGRLPVRVVAMIPYDMLVDSNTEDLTQDEGLSVGPVKVFHGNSLSGRTAWLSEPYVGRPDDYGIPPARSQAQLNVVVEQIHARGMQAAIHSNGDREIDMVLTALEALGPAALESRHRIEHASVMNASLLERARAAGVVLALHSYVYEHGDKMEDYGAARWEWMHANRAAIELGIPVAGNSDYPVSAMEPMLRFQSLLTRRARNGRLYGPSQKITFMQALHTYTRGAAFSVFQENTRGSISLGKLADFVVLDEDPRQVDPERMSRLEIIATWIDGRRADSRK